MTQPVRVLQVIDSLARAGAEQSLAVLAPHLVAEGIDVHVAYLVERDGLQGEFEKAGVPVHSMADRHAGRKEWLASTIDLVDRLRPSVVHTTLFEADLAGRRAAARMNVPCVSSLVNTVYGRTESRDGVPLLKLRAAQAADAYTARRVAAFHAVTRHVASVMSRRLLIPMRKVEVIPRGRDAAVLGRRSAERRAATRKRLGIDDDVPLVLAVGRQEPQKGFDVLLRAVPVMRSQRPGVRVLIAGREGRSTEALAEQVRSPDLGETVTFLGMRDDVPDLMCAADVLAFPSRWEGAAGTLIEAMALECPIVTSRLPTLLETVDESIAELVSPGDPAGLARGILTALAPGPSRAEKVRQARLRFELGYSIDVSARRMSDLYARVARLP